MEDETSCYRERESEGAPGCCPCRTLSTNDLVLITYRKHIFVCGADLGLGKRDRWGRGREAGFTAGAFRGAGRGAAECSSWVFTK